MSTRQSYEAELAGHDLADYLGPYLWTLAVLAWGVGDGVTTYVGYHTPGVVESVPITHWFWEIGGPIGLVTMKLVALASLYSIYHNGPSVFEEQLGVDVHPLHHAIPLGCIHAGAILTTNNLQALGVV